MTAIGLLIALVRYGRRPDVWHATACALIGALAHEADKDYVADLRRLSDAYAAAEGV